MAPARVDIEDVDSNSRTLASVTGNYTDTIEFYLNGSRVTLETADPEITLLEYLRGEGLTGTKLGCAEGGCGACTVVISHYNPTTKRLYHASVNACLAPLVSLDGKHVITVEGIGNVKNPHPVQERIAIGNGSQCGFCTPGIVMSLYALLRNNPNPSEEEVEEAFDGNLCRCTGYRPIIDAAQTFSNAKGCGKVNSDGDNDCCMAKNGSGGCCKSANSNGRSDRQELHTLSTSFTPPGLKEYRPDTELIYPSALRRHEFRPLRFGTKRKRWYRPVTMEQLLEIKAVHPDAKIIGGSSETQIETKFGGKNYSVSVYAGDIPELKEYRMQDDHVLIGGNVTLTDIEGIARDAIKLYGQRRGQPFEAMLHQLRYFAGRQIRNVGTAAGNLATASPISDLNPVFMAANAVLIIRSLDKSTEIAATDFFKSYRTTALPPDGIIANIRLPTSAPEGEYLRAYKVSKRKDDDIAIVNGAMRICLDRDHNVVSAHLYYGGMAPTTIGAQKTMDFLSQRQLADPRTLEGAMNALEADFSLSFGVPGGMASYRKSLALGLFYRFYNDVMVEYGKDSEEGKLATGELHRDISSGKRDHSVALKYEKKILGKEEPHVAALKQCTGEAQYTDDIPVQRNELFGALVLSRRPHAKILKVDYSEALAVPGVVDYVDHTDLPTPESNWWGAPRNDEEFFAVDEVRTAGQPISMILATSAKRAEIASKLVKVEYEDLPAVLTIEEAIEQDKYFDAYRYIKKGDPDKVFESATHIFTGTARMGGQEHFYLETQACVVIPKPEDGELEVWSGTQNPTETQAYCAKVTGVASNKIVAKVKRMGGGFGGKETRSIQLAGILAVAAMKTKRPVRCMLDRDEDIITSGQRHPFLGRWKVAVTGEGKLLALDADVFANGGHSQDLSAAVVERALSHIDGVYLIPDIHVRGRVVKTNTVSNTAFRGFGGPQGMFIVESMISEIADRLNISAHKIRELNMYKMHDITHFNQELTDWFLPTMWTQIQEECSYKERVRAVAEYNKNSIWKKKGIAMIPTKFGISFTALWLNQAGALVHIYHDGSVLVAHGGTEMGQGLHTKMTMIAAEALGIPQSDVHISETATNTVANTSSTAASASSDLNGYAVWNACSELRTRLKPYYEKLGEDAPLSKVAHLAYFDRVNLTAQGFYKTPEIGYVWGENRGKAFFYFTAGVACAEVEVDTLTGEWTCLRADVKMDVGRSINPAIDYGQIEGAFVQGMGLFTMEESLWLRRTGEIATKGPGNYKIPGFRDVPQVLNISLLKDVEWENLRTIQRSRGVGEPPLFMGSAAFFAIRDALNAARRQWTKDGENPSVLSLESPATVERIRLSCNDPIISRARVQPKDGEQSFFVSI